METHCVLNDIMFAPACHSATCRPSQARQVRRSNRCMSSRRLQKEPSRGGLRSGGSSFKHRRPPPEPTAQDVLRAIRSSPARFQVSLCLDSCTEATGGTDSSGNATPALVPLLECGVGDSDMLVEFQRVVMSLRRPNGSLTPEEQLEWKIFAGNDDNQLIFAKDALDHMWAFANDAVMRLRSAGVFARCILPMLQLVMQCKATQPVKGHQQWNRIVVMRIVDEDGLVTSSWVQSLQLPPNNPSAAPVLSNPSLTPLVDKMLEANATTHQPTVVILRGIPGSGKSSLGRDIQAICKDRGVKCVVCSADLFFENPRGYEFDVKKLDRAHKASQQAFNAATKDRKTRLIVVDNTNTQRWEYEPYETVAQHRGCAIEILEMHCPDVITSMHMAMRNSHGVPVPKVVSMYLRWEYDERGHLFSPSFAYPLVNKNPMSENRHAEVTFVGLFLEDSARGRLLADVEPMYPNVFTEHVTLFYKPTRSYVQAVPIGEKYSVNAVSMVHDAFGQTLTVELDDRVTLSTHNKVSHITISTQNNVGASYSNDLLNSNAKRVPLNDSGGIPVNVRMGAALKIQGQRVLITESPIAPFVGLRAPYHCDKESSLMASSLFILHVDMDAISNICLEQDGHKSDDGVSPPLSTIRLQEQLLHHMGSPCSTRRLLCIQPGSNDQQPQTQDLSRIFAGAASRGLVFDEVFSLPSDYTPLAFPQLIEKEAQKNGARTVTVVPLSGDRCKLSLESYASDCNQFTLNVMNFATQLQNPALRGVMDSVGIATSEEIRHYVNRSMHLINASWLSLLQSIGYTGRISNVQRSDCSFTGTKSNLINLCVEVPVSVYQILDKSLDKLQDAFVASMKSNGIDRIVHNSSSPGQMCFQVCANVNCLPVFGLNIMLNSSPKARRLSSSNLSLEQLQFCAQQRMAAQFLQDRDLYEILVNCIRAILIAHCPSHPSDNASLNLVGEYLTVMFLREQNLSTLCSNTTEKDQLAVLSHFLAYLQHWSIDQWIAELAKVPCSGLVRDLVANGTFQAIVRDCASASECAKIHLQNQSASHELALSNWLAALVSPSKKYIKVPDEQQINYDLRAILADGAAPGSAALVNALVQNAIFAAAYEHAPHSQLWLGPRMDCGVGVQITVKSKESLVQLMNELQSSKLVDRTTGNCLVSQMQLVRHTDGHVMTCYGDNLSMEALEHWIMAD